jgi:hypothetical protein
MRRGSDGLAINVTIDAHRAEQAFRDARRDSRQRVKAGLKAAGENVALPEARRRAGALKIAGVPIATTLTVRARSNDAVLTTRLRGSKARGVGLLEFGGTRTDVIKPKGKKALAFGGGHPVANVTTPRRYHAQRFLTGAVNAKRGEIRDAIQEEVMRAFSDQCLDTA